MTYKITIERTDIVTKLVGKDWKVVGQDENGGDRYDYTPLVEKPQEVSEKIYEQVVDELDVPGVIDTINKISQ